GRTVFSRSRGNVCGVKGGKENVFVILCIPSRRDKRKRGNYFGDGGGWGSALPGKGRVYCFSGLYEAGVD
ncbi:MAG: hypothetical protein D3904_18510, partial [Candidatus Electrothrix sp. EH2]|nr:hypothetical protein [Candidatus Electrothrix sp. EH2]